MGNGLRSAKNEEEQFYQALDEESLDSVPFVWLRKQCRHSHGISLLPYDRNYQLCLSVRKLASNWQETEMLISWCGFYGPQRIPCIFPCSPIARIVSCDRNSLVVEGFIEDGSLQPAEQGRDHFARILLTSNGSNSRQCVATTYLFHGDNHLRDNKDANQVIRQPHDHYAWNGHFRYRFIFLEPVVPNDPSFVNGKRNRKLYEKGSRSDEPAARFHSWTGPTGMTVTHPWRRGKMHVNTEDWFAVASDPV